MIDQSVFLKELFIIIQKEKVILRQDIASAHKAALALQKEGILKPNCSNIHQDSPDW